MIRVDTVSPQRKGVVVMLHGWAQNARSFLHKTLTLTRKLKNAGYDVVILEAPHVLPMKGTGVANGGRPNARAWFTYSVADPTDTSESLTGRPITYIGVEDSISLVESFLSGLPSDEFVAIFGFSQGGTFAHVLASLVAARPSEELGSAETGPVGDTSENSQVRCKDLQKICCVICAGAFTATHISGDDSRYEPDLTRQIAGVRSLHIVGRNDTTVDPDKSLELAKMFFNGQTYMHEKGHLVSQNSATCSTIISFLDNSL